MTIGASLFFIAVGAILRFAVTVDSSKINVGVIGDILMVVGVAGLILGLALMLVRRRTDVVTRGERTTIVEPPEVRDPRY